VRHGESQPVDPDQPFDLVDGTATCPSDPVGVDQAERLAERLAGRTSPPST
jgi:broad specificity phosphatase PhoE